MAATLRTRRAHTCAAATLGCILIVSCLVVGGCDVFDPAFLSVISPGDEDAFTSLENAPGHVVVTFVNNATMNERLVEYLVGPGGVVLSEAERRALRPRVRFRVEVMFENGTTMPIEFVDGSAVIDSRFNAEQFPDLDQNTLNNQTILCDVGSVQLLAGSQIEVFIPVELLEFRGLDILNTGGVVIGREFEIDQRIQPTFRPLQVDEIDADGNVVVNRNIDIRDVPAPVTNPFCGSVIAIVMEGELSVPFLTGVSDDPSYDQNDLAVVNTIGGFHQFTVTVR